MTTISTFRIQDAFLARIIFLILAVLTGMSAIQAQETSGGLSGKVIDPNRQPLAGVTVVLVHLPSGTSYSTLTNGKGSYNFINLRIGGPYKITSSMIGMNGREKDSINISLGPSQVLDLVMTESLKSLTEVVVTATKSGTTKTGAGTNINAAQLRNLAASSRSFQDYTRLTPQFNGNSFAGTNFRYNNVTIDGAINNDAIGFSPSTGGQTGTSGQPGSSTRTNPISIDAIQDVQVYLAPYDVKIGNFTGGSINAVTRSGTNEISGSVYGFGKNSTLTGPDHFGQTGKLPSTFHELQTGFRVGFPIIKNKMFFFTNFEITRRVDPITQTDASAASAGILTPQDAFNIRHLLKDSLRFDPGTSGAYTIHSNSTKLFNRLDWNISSSTQLAIRSNIVRSDATNLTRDDQNFRFSGLDYRQVNNQNATVLELRSRFSPVVSNSLILGYSSIHDYREPSSDPYYPQIQIGGNTAGTTILLGTDREASIFNMKQKTIEFTDNLTIFHNNHTFTFGTHNELYGITYGFVNSPNGRIDYPNVASFLAGQPGRIRGNFNYQTQDRDYIVGHPSAVFNVDMFSLYGQDEIRLGDNLRLTPGLRFDLAIVPDKQPYSIKTANATADPNFGNSYSYTKPSAIKEDYFNKIQLSPRIGFNWRPNGSQHLLVRGGSGLFTGRIPFAWLGYSFYNNGNTYGAFDRNNYTYVNDLSNGLVARSPNPQTDPRRPSRTGIAQWASLENGSAALNNNGQTQVDLVDNHFKMPQVWRSSAALEYTTEGGYKFTAEGLFTKTIEDLKFQQVNLRDSATFYQYDRLHQQPIYNGRTADPGFTAVYLLSNTKQGYRYSGTLQINKTYQGGFSLTAAYTYGKSYDVSNGIRNSMESNWQLNQSLNPNNPTLAYSNFDIRHRIISGLNFLRRYGRWSSNFNLFLSAASGQPFTYGFVNTSIQNTGQQVSLAYIPKAEEFSRFFQDGNITSPTGTVQFKTARDQAVEFFRYIRSIPYLYKRLGQFTERNGARTPWNVNADFRFAQEFNLSRSGKGKQVITLTCDILNLSNLLYKEWGRVYFVSDLFNSTASVGLTPIGKTPVAGYPIYTWYQPASPYQTDYFASRWQMQFGLRYSF